MAENEGMPGGEMPKNEGMDNDLFWQEVLRRRDEMPGWALGPLQDSIEPRRQVLADQEFQSKTAEFRDPTKFMDVRAQLDFINRFWDRLGLEMPRPPAEMQKEMAVRASLHPDKRVIQAVLPGGNLTS